MNLRFIVQLLLETELAKPAAKSDMKTVEFQSVNRFETRKRLMTTAAIARGHRLRLKVCVTVLVQLPSKLACHCRPSPWCLDMLISKPPRFTPRPSAWKHVNNSPRCGCSYFHLLPSDGCRPFSGYFSSRIKSSQERTYDSLAVRRIEMDLSPDSTVAGNNCLLCLLAFEKG